jgi:predicted permease
VDELLTARLPAPIPRPNVARRTAFFRALEQRLRATPGVVEVGFVTGLPLGGLSASVTIPPAPGQPVDPENLPWAALNVVNAGYMRAMGIRLVKGRWFEPSDGVGSARVVVVNETMARQFWKGAEPVGRELEPGARVIGVVRDIRQEALNVEQGPAFYALYDQRGTLAAAPQFVLLRTSVDPSSLAGELKRAVWSLERSQPVLEVRTMEDVLARSLTQQRIMTWLVIGFAVLSSILAIVGVHGVLSHLASSKIREIGIRVCLGARPSQVVSLVASSLLAPVAGGVLGGVILSLVVSTALTSWLFGIRPHDTLSFLAAVLLTAGAAILGGLVPVIRSLRVDPAATLRSE